MIKGWTAVYLREMMIVRKRMTRLAGSWAVSPLLYLLAFGYAVGRNLDVGEYRYIEFLIPGLAAMASMIQSFAISGEINISRFYWHVFEEFQSSPLSSSAYVLGEVLAGMTRALLAGLVILILGAFFGVFLSYGPLFWLAFLLNSLVFASLAVGMAMLIRSHADQALLNSFLITPMAFLGGTFFPVENLPRWIGRILYLLPLTHASEAMRSAALSRQPQMEDLLLLGVLGAALFLFAVWSVSRARD